MGYRLNSPGRILQIPKKNPWPNNSSMSDSDSMA